MSPFNRKRTLSATENVNQQNLLQHSVEHGMSSLNHLCEKLHDLLSDSFDNDKPITDSTTQENDDVYHQFLDARTHHHDNLSPLHQYHARCSKFLNEARVTMGMDHSNVDVIDRLKFRREHQKAHGSEECFVDGRYMVWLCGVLFEQAKRGENDKGGTEENMLHLLDQWQDSIAKLLTSEGECMWKLLLQKLGVGSNVLTSATERYVNSFRNRRDFHPLGVYFQWPSFLRNTVLPIQQENNIGNDSNKRRKSNDGSAISLHNYHYQPISLLELMDSKLQYERNAWLPVLGYVITHAFLSCRDDKVTILESMDYVQTLLVRTLPKSLGLDLEKRYALLSGVAAYLIDALGEGLVVGVSSLGDDGNDSQQEKSIGKGNGVVKSILGAEVSQIVDLFCCQGILSILAKYTNTPLAGLVSETANSLLDYSQVHHQIHHETSLAADYDIVAQLIAKDALKVMQFIDKTYPQLKRELSVRKFTKLTYNCTDNDPRQHPVTTYLHALLATGNLNEGSKLCRALENCTGLVKEIERCCWYSLFDKMNDVQVLFEQNWDVSVRGKSHLVAILDSSGKISTRKNGIVTLANIAIGPFGRSVALEYLNVHVERAREELFSNPFKSVRSKEQIDRDKDRFLAIKDSVRRTALKFLLPRPYSPAEALRMANCVAEADKPPLLKNHTNPAQGQDASELCRKILEQQSLSKIWEEDVALEEQEMLAATQETVQKKLQPAEMQKEDQVGEDGLLDMSMELIPLTPAKSPPDISPAAGNDDVIELGDSDDEQINYQDEELSREKVEMEYGSDGIEEQPEGEDESMTKSLESSSHGDDLEKEEPREDYYDSNEECSVENEINYPPNYHQYQGNYSESDDYEQEDEEEANRRVAFEGQHDAEEERGTRGNSSSSGSVEVFDLMSSDDEQENDNDEPPRAEVIYESSVEEERDESTVLNDAVDSYIGVLPQTPQVQGPTDTNDRQILHEKVREYIPVSSPLKMAPERDTNSAVGETLANSEAPTSDGVDILYKIDKVTSEKESISGLADETLATAGAVIKETEVIREKGMAASEEDQNPDTIGAGDALYSSNVGEVMSEDMNADDEHESLDTEDDKRSLEEHEQGETNGEKEAGPSSRVYSNNAKETPDELTEDQPSILVTAARDAAAVPAETHEQDHLSPSVNEDVHLMDSEVEVREGGQFTDDGYMPDAEAAEEDKVEKKNRAIDDGYVPDAEATEEETTKPVGVGAKAATKRDVRFEAVEREETPHMMPLPVEPATTNHSIDEGYLPDGALTEEEKRDRQERRSRSIEAGYSPDGHTTATDDDTAALPAESYEVIDPGYLPSAVEGGTEEERSEEESQAAMPSVLVATALVTQSGASDIANRASLATIALSTQSIDDGYLPESTFDEEERRNLRKETRSHEVEAGYLPDGHTTPGDVTEEEEKDSKSKLLMVAKLKLSKSVSIAEDVQMPPPHIDAAAHSTDDGYLASAADDDTAVEPNPEKETCSDQRSKTLEDRSEGEDTIAGVSVRTKVDHNTGISPNAGEADAIEKNSITDYDIAVAAELKVTDDIAPTEEIPGTNNSTIKHDAPSIENVAGTSYDLNRKDEQPEPDKHIHEESTLLEKIEAITTQAQGKGSQKKRSSARNKTDTVDVKSVQSETSSVRRSSRLQSKKAASSQAIPTSIKTGRGKAPALPAVPEGKNLNVEPVKAKVAEPEATSIPRSTRSRGKKATGDDDKSHASSVNDESSKATTQSKRSRASQVTDLTTKNTGGGKRKKQTEKANSTQSKDKTSPNKRSGVEEGSEEILDNTSESISSSPSKARSRRAKKRDVVVGAQEAVSALGEESPPKRRQGQPRKVRAVADGAESTVSSTATRASRRTRRTPKNDAFEYESIISSPPRTRSKTHVPSQTESLASTRPRRNRKATKKADV